MKFFRKCKFKICSFAHRRYYLHFLFKVLNIGWSKGHLIKDCDNSSFCFSARQVCWLFLKLLCRQLTNYFLSWGKQLQQYLHRFVIFSTFSDCIYQNHPRQRYSALVFGKSIDTTERLLCFIWKCQENNLWLQDSLAEILTHSTVVARSTMVAFTNKNLIFTHLYCTSYSLSVLNSCIKPLPLADLVLWAQKDSCSILRLIEFASSYYALANCVL